MDFLRRRDDSSSDESDELIPPTPAAKSTPLVPVSRQRQPSSSSDSSGPSVKVPTQTSRLSVPSYRSAADTDSSSDGEESYSTSLQQEKMKREPKSASSSESEKQQSTPQSRQLGFRRTERPTHAMSSSGSDDSDVEQTTVQSQPNMVSDSSDESDEDNTKAPSSRNAALMATKVEKPSTTDSSEEESDTIRTLRVPEMAPPAAHASSDGSSYDEIVQTGILQRRADSSSDESEERGQKQEKYTTANASSSDDSGDEVVQPKPQMGRRSDSDGSDSDKPQTNQTNFMNQSHETSSSEDEEQLIKPAVSIQKHQNNFSNDSSSSESSDSEEPVVPVQKHHNNFEKDSSSSESSDSEEPVVPVQNHQNNFAEDSSSSESEEQNLVPPSHSKQNEPSPGKGSDTNSSDEDEHQVKQIFQPPLPASTNVVSSDEDSDDSNSPANKGKSKISLDAASKEDEETYEQKFNPASISSSLKETGFVQPTGPLPRSQQPRKVPVTGKTGISLLKETFKDSDPLLMESAVLAVEDIGSDDEIWLLQCPKTMDIGSIKKQKINLGMESDIQLEDGPTFKRFSVAPEQITNSSVNCLLPHQNGNTFQISSLPIRGKIVIQEHIHVPKLRMPERSTKGPVPFPIGLKVRHPLLGVGFEEHLAEAQKALREGEKYQKHRKSKKRKLSSGSLYAEGIGENLNHSSNQPLPSPSFNSSYEKKTKHRKNSVPLSHETTKNGFQDERTDKQKKRESSRSNNSFNLNLSEDKPVDGSYLNETYKKKHKRSKNIENNSIAREDVIERPMPSWHTPEPAVGSAHLVGESPITKKNKKSKKGCDSSEDHGSHHLSWHTPQLSADTVNATGMHDTDSLKKSKKSKKRDQTLQPSEIKQEVSSSEMNSLSESNNYESSKKRKRKNHEENSGTPPEMPSQKKKKYIM